MPGDKLPKSILEKLRPHQYPPAQQLFDILSREQSACDMSDTGTGKTYVATAVMTHLAIPTLVVVPKIAITSWHRVAATFGEQFSVTNYEKLRQGNSGF